jgi:hypothetical protein
VLHHACLKTVAQKNKMSSEVAASLRFLMKRGMRAQARYRRYWPAAIHGWPPSRHDNRFRAPEKEEVLDERREPWVRALFFA